MVPSSSSEEPALDDSASLSASRISRGLALRAPGDRCDPQGCSGHSGLASLGQEERDQPVHGQIPYPSLPASAGLLSSAELSFPSLLRFIFVSSVICKEPL